MWSYRSESQIILIEIQEILSSNLNIFRQTQMLLYQIKNNFIQNFRLPISLTGAVGSVLQSKKIVICGGQISENKNTTSNCYRVSNQGKWEVFAYLSKPRAFSASIWVPRKGWWITGGINYEELNGISTTDLYSISDEYFTNLDTRQLNMRTFHGEVRILEMYDYKCHIDV